MDDAVIKILFTLFGLHAGVLTWVFRVAWNDVQMLKRELGEVRTNCVACQSSTLDAIRMLIDQRFDKIEELVERKVANGLEAGFTKMELNWINNGQLNPKKKKKDV